MNLKTFLTIGVAAICAFATNSIAQTKTSQLVVTNGTNISKLTPSALGLELNTALVLQSPSSPSTKLVLSIPVTSTTTYFTFPTSNGTLVTTGANTFTGTQVFPVSTSQGDALIASINGATVGSKINAAHLDLTGLGSVTVNSTLAYTGPVLGIDLSNPNTWTGTQIFPTTTAQGNQLISSINAGSSSINLARVNTSTLALAATTVTANAPLTGSGTLGANLNLGLSKDATLQVSGGALGIDLTHANTWTATQTFSQTIDGSINGNAATATTALAISNTTAAGTSAVNAINNGLTGSIDAAHGGTGRTSYNTGDLLVATGATAVGVIAANSNIGYVLTSTGAASAPTWQSFSGAATGSANTFTAQQQFNNNVKIGSGGTPIKRVLYNAATIDFANTASGSTDTKTVTVTGAVVGDIVTLEVPDAEVKFARTFNAWVSAADTVSVKFRNNTGGPENPGSDVFKIMVVGF